MDGPEIISIIAIIVNLIVGWILYNQITSQKQIIKNYKGLVEAIDIAKFKDYSKLIEDMGNMKLEAEKLKYLKEKEEDNRRFKEHYGKYASELSFYVVWSINRLSVDREEKLRITNELFPETFPLIKDRII